MLREGGDYPGHHTGSPHDGGLVDLFSRAKHCLA